MTTRGQADAIDVCFVPDVDYGGDMNRFRGDVWDKIYNRMFDNAAIEPHRHKYNFYIATMPGTTTDCATIPLAVRRAGTFYDAFALLHTTDLTDCSDSGGFGAEGDNTKTFMHEAGHGIYGLADEYEGPTAYHQPNPYPNIWSTEAQCRADAPTFGGNPDECNQFCDDSADCGSGWWRYGTTTTIMVWGWWNQPWGQPAQRRLNWLHSSY